MPLPGLSMWMPESYGGNIESDGKASVANSFGRLWNDLSGTSANNEFNSQEASRDRDWQSYEAALAREFNSAEAQKNRDWQTEMSNTAYQRAVSDMQAAGINPASLGGNSVSAASTPAGGAASASSPTGSSARSAGSSGSLIGLVGQIAMMAITRGLAAKFSNSAMKADSAKDVVKSVNLDADRALSAAKADKWMNDFAKEVGLSREDLDEINKVKWFT